MSRLNIPSTITFPNVGAWADYIKSTPDADGCGSSSHADNRGIDWDDGMTYAQALRVGRAGGYWADGAKMLKERMEITDQFAALEPLPRITRDIVGGAPCVGAYCMGHPKSMYKRTPRLVRGKPILSIGVCMGAVCDSTAKQKANRGAAILTAINELETQGYRCELVAVHRLAEYEADAFSKWFNMEVTLKQSHERYNAANVAFMLAHAGSHRKLMFSAMEKSTSQAVIDMTKWGYGFAGSSKRLNESLTQDFDLWFPGVTPSIADKCNTAKKAFTYIRESIAEQLQRMAEGAGQ